MTRTYAVVSYLIFLVTLVSFVGWLADVSVLKGISDGPRGAVWTAVLIDVALLTIFATQHSVMARPWFKRVTRTVIPPAIERATYVLMSSLTLAAVGWLWRPVNDRVWQVEAQPGRGLLWIAFAAGWAIAVLSTFMIGHFDLFGLKQALVGERYIEPKFGRPGLYALVRHPIMTGFILGFWATPRMTAGHLLFASVSTVYIFVAVRLEERDLRAQLGADYSDYAAAVPPFVPAVWRPAKRHRTSTRLRAASSDGARFMDRRRG